MPKSTKILIAFSAVALLKVILKLVLLLSKDNIWNKVDVVKL